MSKTRALLLTVVCLLASCATQTPEPVSAVTAEASPEAPDGAIRATPMMSAPFDAARPLTRIVFASCQQQNEDQSIWRRLEAERPGLVLLMGDNVYGDVRSADPSLPELKAAYMRLAASEPFARLRATAPVLTVWDDHDYGLNDAGGDFALKTRSEALFDYVWAVPAKDPRRAHPGVYGSFFAGPDGKRAQIILLDTRFFRSPLKPTDAQNVKGKERYLPDLDPAKTMLGEAQWAWLAEELKKPADIRILVSSIQVLSSGHGWEAWRLLPAEQAKLLATLKDSGARNVVILSGDRHFGALYKQEGSPQALVEATASSLNLPASRWRAQSGDTYVEPDPRRLGDPVYDVNYGALDLDWTKGAAVVSLRDAAGKTVRSETIPLAR